ncbi:MAG: hypothetical protein HOE90_14680 [Bacteriovoracaceae bacterium]|jgi:hypothetical protein|nr:hypothetical protein [Bacteriovoracaceae bacterium]
MAKSGKNLGKNFRKRFGLNSKDEGDLRAETASKHKEHDDGEKNSETENIDYHQLLSESLKNGLFFLGGC